MEFTALIANLGKYAAGIVAETPLAFPTTTEQVQKALQTIGVDGLKYEEVIVKEYSIGIAGVASLLGEYAHIDELNYLAKRLECLSPEDLKKFAAAVRHGEYVCSVQDLINLAYGGKAIPSNMAPMSSILPFVHQEARDFSGCPAWENDIQRQLSGNNWQPFAAETERIFLCKSSSHRNAIPSAGATLLKCPEKKCGGSGPCMFPISIF